MTLGLDFASGRPGAANVISAGYGFVCRYLSSGGPGLPGKQLLPWEADDYRNHGVDIVANWETTADRMKYGRSAGAADATMALAQVLACGGSANRPIYFSADWDAREAEQGLIDEYLRGAASVIGVEQVGIYGGYWPVKRALDAGTARWAWQAQAWSGGNVDPRIHILQKNNAGYAWVGGVECDINQAMTTDFGQWSYQGDEDMQLSDTITDAYGNQVSVGDALKWLLYHTDLTVDQIGGAGTRNDMPAMFGGWPQLGGRTLVDALAVIGQKLGIDGFVPPAQGA
jgi:hypothetical protein